MLPVMIFTLIITSFGYIRYLRNFQNILQEIWLDKLGNEVRVVYRNQGYRKLRGVQTEERYLNSYLVDLNIDPNRLPGYKFPKTENIFEYDIIKSKSFWRKYYVNKKKFFLIDTHPIYINYHLIDNIFNGKTINLSQAPVYKLYDPPHEIKTKLYKFNYYNIDKLWDRRITNKFLKKYL